MRTLLVVLVVSAGAMAQAPKPSLMPFPLEFKRAPSGTGAADKDGLQKEYNRLLRNAGVQLPDFAKSDGALAALKRQDCEREDACLQQLAQKAETLYALYVNLDFTLDGAVVASGRAVRDDGKVAAPLKTVTLPKGSDAYRDIARNALANLFSQLKLGELPPVRPVETAVVTPPVEARDAGVSDVPPPPPPPEVTQPAPGGPPKWLGWTVVGVGAAAVVTGAIVFATGPQVRTENGNVLDTDVPLVPARRTADAAGVGLMVGGGVVAAVGAVLLVLAPGDAPVKATTTLIPGGAAVVVGGNF